MPAPERTIGKLVLSVGGRVLRELLIDRKRVTIGRRPYNDLLLDDLTVSGEHAIVHTGPKGESVVHDLQSRNGTLVNGTPVMQQVLVDGDVIDVGIYRIVYRTEILEFNVNDFVPSQLPRGPQTRPVDGYMTSTAPSLPPASSSPLGSSSPSLPSAPSAPPMGPGADERRSGSNEPGRRSLAGPTWTSFLGRTRPAGDPGAGRQPASPADPGMAGTSPGHLDGSAGLRSSTDPSPETGQGGDPSTDAGSDRIPDRRAGAGERSAVQPAQPGAPGASGAPGAPGTPGAPDGFPPIAAPLPSGAPLSPNDASPPSLPALQWPGETGLPAGASPLPKEGAGSPGPGTAGPIRPFVPPTLPSPVEPWRFGRVVIRYLGGHDAGREVAMDRPIVSIRNGVGQVAVIARRHGGYYLTHVEGLAYPLVNGESIGLGAHPLRDNDLIELAGTILQFCLDSRSS